MKTLAFAPAFCYTGLGTELGYPYAKIIAKPYEPIQHKKKNGEEQKQIVIHGIPFGCFCDGLSN